MNRDKMIEWIATHHVGTSSRTMWTGLMGVKAEPTRLFLTFDVPYDSDDFSRCYDLVKFCEIDTTEDFPRILQRFPWYAPIIRNWNRLTEMYEAGNHRGVFNLLSELVYESRTLRKYWQSSQRESFRRKRMCLRDKNKACDLCHDCDVDVLNPGDRFS